MKLLIIFALILSSCSYHPILDQNEKFLKTQEAQVKNDVADCEKKADEYLKQYKARRLAKETGRSAAWGGIFGAIFGLIFGHDLRALGGGAAIGAGAGGVLGATSVAGEGKINPDQLKQRYVANCLGREGYEVIGWE